MKTHLNKQGRPACNQNAKHAYVITRKYAHVTCKHCRKIIDARLKRQRKSRDYWHRKVHYLPLDSDSLQTACGVKFNKNARLRLTIFSGHGVTCKNCLRKINHD